jgi:hypothetical protein
MKMKEKIKIMGIPVVLILALLFTYSYVLAEDDGKYEATVITDSGIYDASVDVLDGEVKIIYRTENEDIILSGAVLDDKEATGTDQEGNTVTVRLKEYKGEG